MSKQIKVKSFTAQDIVTTADDVMDIIKSKLDGTMDIAEIVISECYHRIKMEKDLGFANPRG